MTKRRDTEREREKGEINRLVDWVRSLQRRFEDILDVTEPPLTKTLWDGEACCLEALGEIRETEGELIVTVDLPLVNKEDIEVTVTGRQLEIRARTRREIRFERWGTVQRQISFHSFTKTIPLPPEADTSKVQATFRNGILQVRIPKTLHRRRIPIE